MNDDEGKQVLGKVLADELKAIHELVKDVPKIKQKVDILDSDMKEVKAGVTDLNKGVTNHERRITHLEAA